MSDVITGPWKLGLGAPLHAIVERLNELLYGKRVVCTLYDSASQSRLAEVGYYDVREHCRFDALAYSLHLPIGLGITIACERKYYMIADDLGPSIMDIVGDHIMIAIPYTFFKDGCEISWRRYTITAIGDLD